MFNAEVEVWTNGTTLENPDIFSALSQYANIIVFSIDTFEPDLFASIRCGGDIQQIKKSIITLKKHIISNNSKKNSPGYKHHNHEREYFDAS